MKLDNCDCGGAKTGEPHYHWCVVNNPTPTPTVPKGPKYSEWDNSEISIDLERDAAYYQYGPPHNTVCPIIPQVEKKKFKYVMNERGEWVIEEMDWNGRESDK